MDVDGYSWNGAVGRTRLGGVLSKRSLRRRSHRLFSQELFAVSFAEWRSDQGPGHDGWTWRDSVAGAACQRSDRLTPTACFAMVSDQRPIGSEQAAAGRAD